MIDKFKATIWGLAIGDALGNPTEFKSIDGIKAKFGADGIKDVRQTNGQFTDDTQMTVALAEGLLDSLPDAGESLSVTVGEEDVQVEKRDPESWLDYMSDPAHVMPHVAKQFVNWAFGPTNNRAPGNTCMAGCRALRGGVPWTESGVPHGKGCGSAMRSSPLGLIYNGDNVLSEMARASSVITHGHQSAQDAAHAAALMVRLLLDGIEPLVAIGDVWKNACFDQRIVDLVSRVLGYVGDTIEGRYTPEEVQTKAHLGDSWVGDEAVASALYCFLLAYRRGEGYVETVRYGANTVGDSDSIAAIAGSFAGAYWGLGGKKGVPADWIDHVEDRDDLEFLAQRLYDLRLTLYPTTQEV